MIKLTGNTFRALASQTNQELSSEPIIVNSKSGMTHHGRVIQLQGFKGTLKIIGNTFEKNILGFKDCTVFDDVEKK